MSARHNPARRLLLPLLTKFTLGSAWEILGRLLLLCTVSAVAMGTFTGVYSAIDTVKQARQNWYDEGRLPAMEVRFDAGSADAAAKLRDVTGVTAAVPRTIMGARTNIGETQNLAISLVSTDSVRGDQTPGQLVVLQGARVAANDRDGALVGDELARYHAVGVGDKLRLDVAGRPRTVTVRGIVRDAEHLISPLNPSLFVSAKGSMGMVYVLPDGPQVNSVVLSLRDGEDADVARSRILAKAADLGLKRPYALEAAEQFDYRYVDKNLDIFKIILPILVLIGGLSAAFVSLFLSAQWIRRARQQVAVLLALGYTQRAIAGAFVLPYFLLALLTTILGVLFGNFMGQGFLNTFSDTVGLPSMRLYMVPGLVLIGVLAVVLIFALGAAITLQRVFTMSPKDAMAQVSRNPRVGRLGRMGGGIPWSVLRIAVGNLLRSPLVSLVTVLSVAVGFGLTAAFFLSYSNVMRTSVDSVDRNEWDVMVDFNRPVEPQEARALFEQQGVTSWTPFVKAVGQSGSGRHGATLLIGGFDPKNHWHKVSVLKGHDIDAESKDGVVLESGAAANLGLNPGDAFDVKAAGKTLHVRLVGIMSSALPGEARVTAPLGQELSGLTDQMTGAMVRADEGRSPEKIADTLSGNSRVQQAMTKAEISKLVVQSNDQITALLWIGALMSILVALLLVTACLGYTILSRQQEYRLLSLVGFKDRTVRGIVVLEAALLGFLSVLMALPLSLAISAYLNREISRAWFHVDSVFQTAPLLQTFVSGLLLLPFFAVPLAWFVLPRRSLAPQAREIG